MLFQEQVTDLKDAGDKEPSREELSSEVLGGVIQDRDSCGSVGA